MYKVQLVEKKKKVMETIQKNIGLKIKLALIVPTIAIFLMLYLWITTTNLVFMFIGLTLVIAQISSFAYYSLTSIATEYEERKIVEVIKSVQSRTVLK
ncbi:MAG TPA: hypothetical protein VFV86_09095 [Nitrososphaeraceae archaeon]|nr:hypothetical protein [Nitrososphaeraceae archaeon]